MKVRLKERGWETYTGELCAVSFVNGENIEPMSAREAYSLGGYISIVELNEDGTEGNPVSHAFDMVRNQTVTASVEPPRLRQSDLDAIAAEEAALAAAQDPTKKYTVAELEAIATEKGISGIRAIADQYGVKAVAIKTLIAEILARQ